MACAVERMEERPREQPRERRRADVLIWVTPRDDRLHAEHAEDLVAATIGTQISARHDGWTSM